MSSEIDVYDRLLIRRDVWSKQNITSDEKGRYGYTTQKYPLTRKIIDDSLLQNSITIGAYTVKPVDNTVINPTVDIDNHDGKTEIINDVRIVYNALSAAGVFPYIEGSAGELKYGTHIGSICKPTDAKTVTASIKAVIDKLKLDNPIEINPKQETVEEGKYGNLVKLPFQFHNRTKARSQIYNPETLEPFTRDEAITFMLALPDTVFEIKEGIETPIQAIKEATTATTEPIKSDLKNAIAFDNVFKLDNIKSCIKACYDNDWVLHGKGDAAHNFRIAIAGNMLYNGASDQQVNDYFSIQSDYSAKTTNKQIQSINEYLAEGKKPMGCKTIMEKCSTLLNRMCETCENKPKDKKIKGKIERITPIQDITDALDFKDNYDMAVQVQKVQPIYYDRSRNYYLWKKIDLYWQLIDKTDILNSIIPKTGSFIIESKTKNEIIESIGMTGRQRDIKDVKTSWVYCKNGVYDSETKQIFNPTHDYFFTQPIPHNIGSSEDTPIIDRLFKDWMGDRAPILYEVCAYCLYNGYPIHRMFWLFGGSGRNGKDQFLELLQRLVGKENAIATDLEILLSSRFESSKLYRKKLAVISETNFNIIKNSGLLKALTGHSYLRGEFKGKDGFDFYNTAKIVIATNGLPETTDKSKAFFARCITLEFKNRFAGKEFNTPIIDTIPEYEYETLIRKCFNKILPELLKNGEFYKEGTEEEKEETYERISNPFLIFRERELIDDKDAQTPVWVLRELYNIFANKNNYRKCGEKEFTQILVKENIDTERKLIGAHKWNIVLGIKTRVKLVYSHDRTINHDVVQVVHETKNGDDVDDVDAHFSLSLPRVETECKHPVHVVHVVQTHDKTVTELSQKDKMNSASQLITRHYGRSPISQAGIELEADYLKTQLSISKDDAIFYIKQAISDRDKGR